MVGKKTMGSLLDKNTLLEGGSSVCRIPERRLVDGKKPRMLYFDAYSSTKSE